MLILFFLVQMRPSYYICTTFCKADNERQLMTFPHLVEAEHFGRIDPSQWTMHNEMFRTHNSIPAARAQWVENVCYRGNNGLTMGPPLIASASPASQPTSALLTRQISFHFYSRGGGCNFM